MRHLKLTVKEDIASGEQGLILNDIKMIDTFMVATEGLIIAHDILEHQNGLKAIGSVDDELEALGGVWYVRGHLRDMRRDGIGSMYTPEESLASDVMNLGRIHNNGVNFRNPVPATRASEAEDSLQEICQLGFKDLRNEMAFDEIDQHRFTQYKASAIHYLRRGYSKAKRRFGSHFKANNMFWQIAEAVEPYTKGVEYAGQEFRLSYDSNRAICQEIYNFDEY